MKIFSCEQIREIDAYTIKHEPVSSVDLMERAAGKICSWITGRFRRSEHFLVFAGPGNNGGDGLALARMLKERGYSVDTYCLQISDKTSHDHDINRKRLEDIDASLNDIHNIEQMPVISSGDVIIDAIFGSGLTRASEGLSKEIIKKINHSDSIRISIDIPSGLFCGDNSMNDKEGIINAHITLSFQFPKLSFMFADNSQYVGEWFLLPIGLADTAIRNTATPYYLLKNQDVLPLIKQRKKFDHKGNFGHGLLIAGSYGKMGAAVMGARAALRTGIGLLTVHTPGCGNIIMQCSVPEAMVKTDSSEKMVSEIGDVSHFSAVGIGSGLGTEKETQEALRTLLKNYKKPMVIDADALNMLSYNKEWLTLLPAGTILTPHLKEFERLAGECSGGYERLMKQVAFSERYNSIVILKGAYSSVTFPNGTIHFNSTGNPGMATGGSGDALTGMILSLLSQGYSPENSAIFGVYLHGLAGDLAVEQSSVESIIASDIINCIGKAFNRIRGSENQD